jgi:hypothetical protein
MKGRAVRPGPAKLPVAIFPKRWIDQFIPPRVQRALAIRENYLQLVVPMVLSALQSRYSHVATPESKRGKYDPDEA